MKLKAVAFFLSLIVLISCKTIKPIDWNGKTKRDLVLELGPSSRIASDENGGEIYTYEERVIGSTLVLVENKYVNQQRIHLNETFYFIDKGGRIYKTLHKSQLLK